MAGSSLCSRMTTSKVGKVCSRKRATSSLRASLRLKERTTTETNTSAPLSRHPSKLDLPTIAADEAIHDAPLRQPVVDRAPIVGQRPETLLPDRHGELTEHANRRTHHVEGGAVF